MIMIGMQKYPLVRLSANMVFILSHIFRGLCSEDHFFTIDSALIFHSSAGSILPVAGCESHDGASEKRNKCDANEARA